MAKRVVKYLLEGDGTIPTFVLDGGYFPVGGELVGVTVDEDVFHVPSTVVRMAKADLTARLAAISMVDRDGNALSDDDKAAMLTAWLAMVGQSDLA